MVWDRFIVNGNREDDEIATSLLQTANKTSLWLYEATIPATSPFDEHLNGRQIITGTTTHRLFLDPLDCLAHFRVNGTAPSLQKEGASALDQPAQDRDAMKVFGSCNVREIYAKLGQSKGDESYDEEVVQ